MRIFATCPECGGIEFVRTGDGDFKCINCDAIIMPDEFGLASETEN